jgi:hypothetical protein
VCEEIGSLEEEAELLAQWRSSQPFKLETRRIEEKWLKLSGKFPGNETKKNSRKRRTRRGYR